MIHNGYYIREIKTSQGSFSYWADTTEREPIIKMVKNKERKYRSNGCLVTNEFHLLLIDFCYCRITEK